MNDSKYPHNSRWFASEYKKTHEEIISDIEYVITIFPNTQEYFLYVPASPYYYLMTSDGCNILQEYWRHREDWDAYGEKTRSNKSEYIYDSRDLAKTTSKTHEEIVSDIMQIVHILPDHQKQFIDHVSLDTQNYYCSKFYRMTQKGYDLLQDYWTTQNIYNAAETMVYTDKNGNTIADWSDFKHDLLLKGEFGYPWDIAPTVYATDKAGNKLVGWTKSESEPHISQIKNPWTEGENTMNETNTTTSKPRCKKLLDLWYNKSKDNIYAAVNTRCGELLEKDPLTQKIVQSLQTIRVLWGTDHPGDDNERQKEYKKGPGYYFELWMRDYNALVESTEIGFWGSIYFNNITYTTATEKLLKSLEEKSKQLFDDLYTKHIEILTQIKAADTYEQEINILKAYGVLDYNGIISPVEADDLKAPLTLEE